MTHAFLLEANLSQSSILTDVKLDGSEQLEIFLDVNLDGSEQLEIFLVLFVGAKLRQSELDLVLRQESLERDVKLSHVITAGTPAYSGIESNSNAFVSGTTSYSRCVWDIRW
eukprot:CAMPEP_0201945966 /NCGR_PEP_ID=MMETSP0903-20130614/54176_1 /ASSEMBLY_ACC=CAM_ASM_000552 /TAXON_ID=420261 /ORGANISM="Thalassiosira antarctica, Strain CCMP982" /LENGTH=111 /DNA_ID=CAMNT_0048489053 /DNA_START=615 /DNA_END=947 /DNA_ORIENTATION=-